MIPHHLLQKVTKPARYIGNEINMVRKNPQEVDLRFAFCFPDIYEIGMSHLGLQILYFFLNRRKDVYCERAFAPWFDMEDLLRENNLPLGTLETGDSLKVFDIVGFTLQYELSYTNILNMLELSDIPVLSKDRTDNDPIICAGGPCAYNPEPLALVVDFFYIGEGEVSYDEILDIYIKNKKSGGSRDKFLQEIVKIKGVYVPKFYDAIYDKNKIVSFKPINDDAPTEISKVLVEDLENSFFPEKFLVPLIETVHDRVSLEVFRGCVRGCRFCQAGYIYRPYREKSAATLLEQADSLVKSSGHEEISLVSLSTGDYTQFQPLTESILENFKNQRVNISLPSLRIDAFSLELMNRIQEVRKSSLTFAPEAGTQRLRDVINKGITEQEILEGCRLAFLGGWNRIKLYFLMGLPTETDEDLLGIVKLSEQIVKEYYSTNQKRPLSVVASVSCLVPKPFTPFQWEGQDSIEEFSRKQELIKKSFKKKQIKFIYSHPDISLLECALSRGDRRVCYAIINAFKSGSRFDGWTEHFSFENWKDAFRAADLEFEYYTSEKSLDDILPWSHINIGVSKDFLISELKRAKSGEITGNCRENCSACGMEKSCHKPAVEPKKINYPKKQSKLSKVNPYYLRLKFSKLGKMRYIGHLDLQTLFQRAIIRANLPIEYSQGFNPHQIISFAQPLSLGMSSVCEYVDLFLNEEIETKTVIDDLNASLPEGFTIIDAEILPKNTKPPRIKSAEYKIKLPKDVGYEELNLVVAELLSQSEIIVKKTTKSKTSSVDIREQIISLAVEGQTDDFTLVAVLSAGSQNNLKPQILVDEVLARLKKEINLYEIEYIRTCLFFD